MFYKKKDVNKIIVCGLCDNIYKDPRFLPCSESACHECIQHVIECSPSKVFDCKFCQDKHKPVGDEYFPVNRAISRFLEAKADHVYRGVKVEELIEKLAVIRSKCYEFKSSLDMGIDQVKEHCAILRHQVHLETDILIEEAHRLNECLIAEIDKYEDECIGSFTTNIDKQKHNYEKLISELDEFNSDNSKYLSEFRIDERVIDETTARADSHLRTLMAEDRSLKKILFNGEIVEFVKRQVKIDETLLGTLVYKPLSFGFDDLRELTFSNGLVNSYRSNMNLFKHDDGNSVAFYIDNNRFLNISSFDGDGRVVRQVSNVLEYNSNASYSKISQFKAVKSVSNFICYVSLPGHANYGAVCGHHISNLFYPIKGLLFMIDEKFAYLEHSFSFSHLNLLHMAANNSNVLCVDSNYNYFYLNMSLKIILDKQLNAIRSRVGNTVVDVQMSEQFVFFLCNDSKLKMFEIESGVFVRELETSASQIKLLSSNRLVLFDSVSRVVHVYEERGGELCKLEEVDLAKSLEGELLINRDHSNTLAFYNSKRMRYTSLDHV
jgi:hypothetical protein